MQIIPKPSYRMTLNFIAMDRIVSRIDMWNQNRVAIGNLKAISHFNTKATS